ncbi:hypothetical protein NB705_003640 [Xanthomonas sacchari]|nr:hypothetical protein [Xanthomonas sacchari]
MPRHQQPAFVQRESLAGGQAAEADVAAEAGRAAVGMHAAQRLRRVLDQQRAAAFGGAAQRCQVDQTPAQMGGDDGQGVAAAALRQLHRVQFQRAGQQIAQHQLQAAVRHRQRHQRAGIGRHQHLPAPVGRGQGAQGHDQRGGARAGQQGLRQAERAGQAFARPAWPQVAPLQRQAGGRWDFSAHRRDPRARRSPGRRCRRRSAPRPAPATGRCVR